MTTEIYAGLQKDVRRDFFFSLPNPLDRITALVFDKCGVDIKSAKTHYRGRQEVNARQISMYIARVRTPLKLKEIGLYFGGRDHATVIYASETVQELMFSDKEYKKLVNEILELL